MHSAKIACRHRAAALLLVAVITACGAGDGEEGAGASSAGGTGGEGPAAGGSGGQGDCVPATCASARACCTTIEDGCGEQVECGPCDGEASCGGGPQGCEPWVAPRGSLFVDPGGSDDADCSDAAPCASISRASELAAAGTVVVVAPGTYGPVTTGSSGVQGAPIRYLSRERWGARIVSDDETYPWLNTGDWVEVVGFELTSTARGADSPQEGIESNASHVRILGNRVHDVALDPGCYGDNGGAGINHGDYGSEGNDTVGNWVYATGAAGCALVHGVYDSTRGGVIANNIVADSRGGFGIHTYHAATHVAVINNTVLYATTEERGCIILAANPEDFPDGEGENDHSVLANNLTGHCNSGLVENSDVGSNNRIVSNLAFDTPDGACNTSTDCEGTISEDPQLVNDSLDASSADYHLAPGSPAVDAGVAEVSTGETTAVPPALDFDGWPRSGAPDIGALEQPRAGPAPCWPWL